MNSVCHITTNEPAPVLMARHEPLPTPAQVREAWPLDATLRAQIHRQRQQVRHILNGDDNRLLVIAGPCSLHDEAAALEYAERLKRLSDALQDRLCILMRAYLEKPRTSVGWKGLLHQPALFGTANLSEGVQQSRKLLCQLAATGLGLATEALHPLAADYLQDLITWTAIGARTTESQTHREMASGLPSVVGFKNGTDGRLTHAIHAIKAARHSHQYLGYDAHGQAAVITTQGNPHTHVVLRGGGGQPNYQAAQVAAMEAELRSHGITPRLLVDCSHENSGKCAPRQLAVLDDVAQQRRHGNRSIMGVMLESHLHGGRQDITTPEALRYGVSVTDACLGWDDTEQALQRLYQRQVGIN